MPIDTALTDAWSKIVSRISEGGIVWDLRHKREVVIRSISIIGLKGNALNPWCS
jgi:hypothetical protein